MSSNTLDELSNFQITKKLGSGSYSSVYKATRKSDKCDYALKKIKLNSLSSKEKENAVNEIRFLASINSPYVVSYMDSLFDSSQNFLYIVMEYMPGGDVLGLIKSKKEKKKLIDEELVWRYLISISRGLKSLHDMKILHRDLKCANIMLSADGKEAKIGDLNVSKVAKQGMLYTQTGTPYYASPEVWKDKPYNSKSDIWSLGCVLYEICAQRPPFMGKTMQDLYSKIQKGQFDPIPSLYSTPLSHVIEACLSLNPSQRPSCDRILNNPTVQKKIELYMIQSQVSERSTDVTGSHSSGFKDDLEQKGKLLDTIRIGRNLKNLATKLPKHQYSKSLSKQKIVSATLLDNKENNSYLANNEMAQLAVVKQNLKKRASAKGGQQKSGHNLSVQSENNLDNIESKNYQDQKSQILKKKELEQYINMHGDQKSAKRNNSYISDALPPISTNNSAIYVSQDKMTTSQIYAQAEHLLKKKLNPTIENSKTPYKDMKKRQLKSGSVQNLDIYSPPHRQQQQGGGLYSNQKQIQTENDLDKKSQQIKQIFQGPNSNVQNAYQLNSDKKYIKQPRHGSNNNINPMLPKLDSPMKKGRHMSMGQVPLANKLIKVNHTDRKY